MDLVEPGIDDVFLRRQLGRRVLADLHRGGAELLALEDDGLLERGPHRRVALDAGVRPHLGQRRIDRRLHGLGRIERSCRRPMARRRVTSTATAAEMAPTATTKSTTDELSMHSMMTGGCDTDRGPHPPTCLRQMRPRAV